jgi:hypothetical protein
LLQGRNISFAGFEAATTTEPNTLRDIRSKVQAGDMEAAAKTAQRAGLGETLVNDKGNVDTKMLEGLERVSRVTTMRRLTSFGKVNKETETEIMEGIEQNIPFEKLSKAAQDTLQALGQTARGGRVSGQAIFGGVASIADVAPGEGAVNEKQGGVTGQVEKTQQIQAQAMAKPIITGMENLGKNFTDALSKTNKIFEDAAKAPLKAMQDNAKEAAERFEIPINAFEGHVDNFGTAVAAFESLIKNDFKLGSEAEAKWKKMQQQADDMRQKIKKSAGE